MEDNQTKVFPWYKSTTVHQVWDPWRIDGGIVMIHFILYSNTLLDSTDIFFFHTYLYYLLIHAYSSTYSCTVRAAMHSSRSHAQFTQPCTVCAAMHSSRSHAQFAQPCTVCAAMHSLRSHAQFAQPCTVRAAMHSSRSHAQFVQPRTVLAQSTRSHAQFMSLSI